MMESMTNRCEQVQQEQPLIITVTILTSTRTSALQEIRIERSMNDRIDAMARLGGGLRHRRHRVLTGAGRFINRPCGAVQNRDSQNAVLPGQKLIGQRPLATPGAASAAPDCRVVGRAVTATRNPGSRLMR